MREIFKRYADGESMKAIASDLNARGIPSPGASWARKIRRKDGRWLVSGIHTLLHNELYTGRVIWNRREFRKDPDSGKRTYRERPQSEWKEYFDETRVLIDPETWKRCTARMGGAGGGHKGSPSYLLSGLLTCGVCGARMIVYGGKQRRYVCGTNHHGGDHACANAISVPRVIAEDRILEPVIADLTSPTLIDEMTEAMRAEQRREVIQPTTTPNIERIDVEIASLRKLVIDGVLTATRAAPAIEAAEKERDALTASQRRKTFGVAFTTEQMARFYREEAAALCSSLQGKDVVQARETLRSLIGEVRCMPSDGYLVAHYRRGVLELMKAATAGVYQMVAGVRFESVYPPVVLKRRQ